MQVIEKLTLNSSYSIFYSKVAVVRKAEIGDGTMNTTKI